MLSLISDTIRSANDRRRAAQHARDIDAWADRFVPKDRAAQMKRRQMNQRNLW